MSETHHHMTTFLFPTIVAPGFSLASPPSCSLSFYLSLSRVHEVPSTPTSPLSHSLCLETATVRGRNRVWGTCLLCVHVCLRRNRIRDTSLIQLVLESLDRFEQQLVLECQTLVAELGQLLLLRKLYTLPQSLGLGDDAALLATFQTSQQYLIAPHLVSQAVLRRMPYLPRAVRFANRCGQGIDMEAGNLVGFALDGVEEGHFGNQRFCERLLDAFSSCHFSQITLLQGLFLVHPPSSSAHL